MNLKYTFVVPITLYLSVTPKENHANNYIFTVTLWGTTWNHYCIWQKITRSGNVTQVPMFTKKWWNLWKSAIYWPGNSIDFRESFISKNQCRITFLVPQFLKETLKTWLCKSLCSGPENRIHLRESLTWRNNAASSYSYISTQKKLTKSYGIYGNS